MQLKVNLRYWILSLSFFLKSFRTLLVGNIIFLNLNASSIIIMRNFITLIFILLTIVVSSQENEKFSTNAQGNIQIGISGYSSCKVTWIMSTYFVNNTEVSRVFYLPKSNAYDISIYYKSLPKTNGIAGLYIKSKENLVKFAEALIYFGKQKGINTEKLVIDSNENIELGLISTFPDYVMIGSTVNFALPKKNAIKLGEAILENILRF